MNSMKFRDSKRAGKAKKAIERLNPDENLKIMHVCGTHESAICEYGIRSILPENIDVVEGPGCPVCVTPTNHVDEALKLAEEEEVILATFGDMIKVPGSSGRLTRKKDNVQIVYSVADAVELAEEGKEVVFLGIGFETTIATYAPVLLDEPSSFSFLGSVKRIPPAMKYLLKSENLEIDGFLAPGHVSTIIGAQPYIPISEKHGVPISITGFEPLDILFGIVSLLKQMKYEPEVENVYPRAVKQKGNVKAQELIEEAFEPADASWRGIGEIPDSGLEIENEELDARKKYDIKISDAESELSSECICDEIILGKSKPDMCKLFNEGECNPENPIGPCMVGSEGMCHVWYEYGGRPKIE